MHNRQNYLYVGVDLHKEHHTAVIINCWQEKLGEIQFENKPSAFSKFLLEVETYVCDGITVVFGLEDVGGYGRALAKYLVDHERFILVDTTTSFKKECISKSTKCIKEPTTYSIKPSLSKL